MAVDNVDDLVGGRTPEKGKPHQTDAKVKGEDARFTGDSPRDANADLPKMGQQGGFDQTPGAARGGAGGGSGGNIGRASGGHAGNEQEGVHAGGIQEESEDRPSLGKASSGQEASAKGTDPDDTMGAGRQ